MPSTRSSRPSGAEPKDADRSNGVVGSKRKIDATSPAKEKKEPPKKAQKSLEETMPKMNSKEEPQDEESKDDDTKGDSDMKDADTSEAYKNNGEKSIEEENTTAEGNEQDKPDADQSVPTSNSEPSKTLADADAVEHSSQREKQEPSNLLEKGIIYFFTRSRVGIDDPESAADLQRTFFVLRPLPAGAKLTDGALDDSKNNRVFALPKKVFPKSHSDRFMAFVEKAGTSIEELKESFFQGTTYDTKTQGTREVPPIQPVGEGIYAITETGRQSHLAYMLTIPSEIGEVQEELGIGPQGSFVISVKNPTRKGPASASLPQSPDFPQEIIDEFRGLAWKNVNTKMLDYENAQILLIGAGGEDDLGAAVEPPAKDRNNDNKETPQEEMEKLEHEDELRVDHLKGDDTIFEDLGISKKEYGLFTRW